MIKTIERFIPRCAGCGSTSFGIVTTYTADEVNHMGVGDEINALVAEYLFGWKWNILGDDFFLCGDSGRRYRPPKTGEVFYGGGNIDFPNFSARMHDAWSVWEKLVEMERYPTLHAGPDEAGSIVYSVELVNPANISVWAETAPLAICRAALQAVLMVGR